MNASEEREDEKNELKLIVTRLEEFSTKVQGSLKEADWNTQREILRSIVKRVEVADDAVRVIYRVDPRPFVEGPSGGRSQHCWRRDLSSTCQRRPQCDRGKVRVLGQPPIEDP